MGKSRIVYIVSDINKALAFEWIVLRLRERYDLCFILIENQDTEFSAFLKDHSIPFYKIKSSSSRIIQLLQMVFILRREKPVIVHTHLWQANLIGLTAAWLLQIKRRIYTRHHATVHYHEHPSGRKWDILCNTLATNIIAISQNTFNILINWDKANERKVKVVRHGFNLNYFESVTGARIEILRVKYNINKNTAFPVIGVISRYMEWKGVQYIIPAFQKLKEQFPDAKLILANAHGVYEDTIREMLQSLPGDSFIEIRFEEDLAALYHLFDVFVHVPVDPHVEAFGQTYIEALISRIPSVFTLSGIAREFVTHKHNAWVVDFKSSDQIVEGIKAILSNAGLREVLRRNGLESTQQFSLDRHILALEKLYSE